MNNLSKKAKNAFPQSEELRKALTQLFLSIDDEFAVKTVNRQIYSERERYTKKSEVDNALLSSKIIGDTTEIIKGCCESQSVRYVDEYLNLLAGNMERLTSVCYEFCNNFILFQKEQTAFLDFLSKYIYYADVDNAHAMYLSSDNWDFSVFHNVISKLQEVYTDPKDFEEILKGGIVDIRTHIYDVVGTYKVNSSIEQHVANYLRKQDCVTSELWTPILLYHFPARINSVKLVPKTQFTQETELIQAYNDLYHARYLYDSFEYFGFYGFVRNAIAELCANHAETNEDMDFLLFAKYITLYQFNFCTTLKKYESWKA
jgi:hypothetical protein